jgi:hypothetical protein
MHLDKNYKIDTRCCVDHFQVPCDHKALATLYPTGAINNSPDGTSLHWPRGTLQISELSAHSVSLDLSTSYRVQKYDRTAGRHCCPLSVGQSGDAAKSDSQVVERAAVLTAISLDDGWECITRAEVTNDIGPDLYLRASVCVEFIK